MNNREQVQLNVQVPTALYKEVKKAAVDGHLKLRKLVQGLLWLGLYFKENLGVKETLQAIRDAEPLACLLAARNDLANRGFNTSGLDEIIRQVEIFLEASQITRKGGVRNECSQTSDRPTDH